ncbi:reverse transcriptase domain-containing protein [Tanacetum coccineum]
MPLSVWKKLSLPELTPTRMTLKLANRLVAIPVGVAKDVFVKVGKFYFLADFVVVDYDVDPRVPFILGRPFLRTARALSDVHVNVIDVACEEYTQEVLGFSDSSTSGNPTPSDPIIASSSPSFTPFEGGDFILEEIEACLSSDSIPPKIDVADFDPEGDIRLLEKLLNDDPSSPLPSKELNFEELKTIKSSIDDPPELELKDLPSHLEYAFLEGTDKLPVIISKELKDEEKAAFLKVLKSHKRAITWKIYDIKGIDPCFYTHKILMEDDFKPAVQHQRRVNPKIHEVIKKEVIKLLDAGLIYPISDSPWVSPVHCVPKKGGMTVVENEDNELIPTRNEYYCFLDGFSGYFQIPIDLQDQEKTTFTCPYGTFAYRRMPFGLCNAPGTFQRCMMAIFHDMIEETWGFHGRFLGSWVFSFSACPLAHLCQNAQKILLLQEFDVIIHDKKEAENLAADHLSRLENPHQAKKPLISSRLAIMDPPEDIMGIDFIGPFSSSRGNKYILVAVDYLYKWVKAKSLPTNDARVVVKILKSLFARFGTPRAIISDCGTHFYNDQFAKVMLKYGVTHHLSTAYQPQTSGQVEVSNRGLKRILERTVGENHASWSDKLDDALWAFYTAFKTPIGCTPYKLLYEKACHLPIELEHMAY